MLGVPLGRGDSEAPEERALGRRRHGKGVDDWTCLFLNDLQGSFFSLFPFLSPHLGLLSWDPDQHRTTVQSHDNA